MTPAALVQGLKLCCLLLYAGGALAAAAVVAHPLAQLLRLATGFVLTMHALQVVFCWRELRRYPGGMPASILLTLLFGLLHWVPMRWDAQRQPISTERGGTTG